MIDAQLKTAPVRPADYPLPLPRKESPRTSPLDENWLMSRELARSMERAREAYVRGRLLDVGCGGRPYEELLAPLVERYVGIDTPASELSRYDVGAVASHLPFRAGAFDTVLCTEVLEHLSDPAACVTEIARVLRPGGHLILTSPQTWPLHEEPYDFFRFTRYGLSHLCRRAGLDVVETRPHGGPWAVLGTVLLTHRAGPARRRLDWFGSRAPKPGAPPRPRWLWPLKAPLLLADRLAVTTTNRLCAALDRLPHPGILTLGNMVVARKPAEQ